MILCTFDIHEFEGIIRRTNGIGNHQGEVLTHILLSQFVQG